ncbi:MAG TPA: tetratricopeptide repeat protein [Polyangiales bacterium]
MVRVGTRMRCANVGRVQRQWLLIVIVLTFLAPRRVGAQADASVPAAYETEIGAAVDAHDRGHFAEARTHFLRAHEVFPNARTSRGLGKVEFELGDYAAAERHLQQALASSVRPLSEELRVEVVQLLARARAATVSVALTVRPASARVSLDGAAVPVALGQPLVVNTGEHVLEVQASGYLSERRAFVARAGERIALDIALAEPSLAAARTAQPVQRIDPPRVYRQWWFWTLSGVAAAGVTATAVLLATRDHHAASALDGTFANP